MSKRRKQKKNKKTTVSNLSPLEKAVARAIPIGRFNAKTTREISNHTALPIRTIREIVNRLIISHGFPICGAKSGKRGLYYPLNDKERNEGIEPLRELVIDVQTRIKTVSRADLTKNLTVIHGLKTEGKWYDFSKY